MRKMIFFSICNTEWVYNRFVCSRKRIFAPSHLSIRVTNWHATLGSEIPKLNHSHCGIPLNDFGNRVPEDVFIDIKTRNYK